MESNFTPAGRTSESGTRAADDRANLSDWRAEYADKVKSAEKAMQLVRLRRIYEAVKRRRRQ